MLNLHEAAKILEHYIILALGSEVTPDMREELTAAVEAFQGADRQLEAAVPRVAVD